MRVEGEAEPGRQQSWPGRRGQTTLVFIVVIILVFAGMGAFLLSLAKTVSQSEYLALYTHRLLSSLLRKDTGYTEASCRTTADLLACSFLTPTYTCGTQSCESLARQEVTSSLAEFSIIREGFRTLLTVEPEGFTPLPGGSPISVAIGDPALQTERTGKITASERIQKVFGGNPYRLTIRLTIAKLKG